ncbi:MAG: hypothetical protein PHE49_03205 [bacterium]|nr:hypothetical protein [bacterium]
MKKIAFGWVLIILGTTRVFPISVGAKVPFNGLHKTATSSNGNQYWFGGGVSIEGNFFFLNRKFNCPQCGKEYTKMFSAIPTFGIEFNYNYETSTGNDTSLITYEAIKYKETGNVFSLLVKYYFPLEEEAQWCPFVSCGPKFRMYDKEITVNDSSFTTPITEMKFMAPVGFEYRINEKTRFMCFGELSFNFGANGATTQTSYGSIFYGLGVGIKQIL